MLPVRDCIVFPPSIALGTMPWPEQILAARLHFPRKANELRLAFSPTAGILNSLDSLFSNSLLLENAFSKWILPWTSRERESLPSYCGPGHLWRSLGTAWSTISKPKGAVRHTSLNLAMADHKGSIGIAASVVLLDFFLSEICLEAVALVQAQPHGDATQGSGGEDGDEGEGSQNTLSWKLQRSGSQEGTCSGNSSRLSLGKGPLRLFKPYHILTRRMFTGQYECFLSFSSLNF